MLEDTKEARMGVGIKDIAKRAEVSPAAVSLVLNNKPGVGPDTREKILRIARELGYDGPRPAGSSRTAAESVCFLRIPRHGHAVNRDHDVFIADYIDGLGQGARTLGFELVISTHRATPIEKILEAARATDSAGFVVLGTELSEEDVAAFGGLAKPVVFIDTWLDFLPFDFVDMNNEDSVFTVVEYFASKGHRNIGLVKGSIETRNFKLREEGFQASLARVGLPFDPGLVLAVDSTFHGAFEDMTAILDRGVDLPPALFCANDIIACGCLRALHRAGVRVPDQVSVIGFDDLPISANSDPPLTTVRVSKAEIGRMAIQLLATRLRYDSAAPPVKALIGG